MSLRKLLEPNHCSFRIEKEYPDFSLVGLDEVGRGCIAGPVVVAAVSFPREHWDSGDPELAAIQDSKKISAKRRDELYDYILAHADLVESLDISAQEVDKLNVLRASLLGFKRLIDLIHPERRKLDLVLVDGNQRVPDISMEQRCIIGGDSFSKSIAAASIVAKVRRDRWMKEIAKTYPQYAFEKHKGYGTKAHWEALNTHGPCVLHRRSFLGRALKLKIGREGESQVSQYLEKRGFEILHRNWRCKLGEIDIVARKENRIHFIEVRKRDQASLEFGFPKSKQDQFKKVIQVFLTRKEAQQATAWHSHFFGVSRQGIQAEWDVFKL